MVGDDRQVKAVRPMGPKAEVVATGRRLLDIEVSISTSDPNRSFHTTTTISQRDEACTSTNLISTVSQPTTVTAHLGAAMHTVTMVVDFTMLLLTV